MSNKQAYPPLGDEVIHSIFDRSGKNFRSLPDEILIPNQPAKPLNTIVKPIRKSTVSLHKPRGLAQ